MISVSKALSTSTLEQLAYAGAGAIAAGFTQSYVPATTVNNNIRDAILVVAAGVLVTMGGSGMKAFGVGFGAAVVGSLVVRNVLVG